MDSASTSSPISPLKRRACVSCTAVKAKCSPHPTLRTICERCNRLGKDCVFLNLPERRRRLQSPRAVYPTTASPAPISQVATLENKLEALAAELAALKQQQPNGGSSGSASQSGATPSVPTPGSDDDANGPVLSTTESDADPHHRQGGDIIDRGWITTDDAEHLVATFKQQFIPRFPFVALTSSETAVQLRRHSPFLFLCIVAVPLYTNPPLQQRLGKEIRRQLSLRLLLNAERSMDLLRGLLVHAAWYQYFACLGNGQLFMLSQLCVTVVYDLRLPEGGYSAGKAGGVSFSVDEDHGKRAVLGTFWLSVVCVLAFPSQSRVLDTDRYHQRVANAAQTGDRTEAQQNHRRLERGLRRGARACYRHGHPADDHATGLCLPAHRGLSSRSVQGG